MIEVEISEAIITWSANEGSSPMLRNRGTPTNPAEVKKSDPNATTQNIHFLHCLKVIATENIAMDRAIPLMR